MEIFLQVAIACLILQSVFGVSPEDFDEEEDEDDFSPMVGEKNDRFDWILCQTLDEMVPTNIIFSPINMKLMMVLLYEASMKDTAGEIQKVLKLDANRGLVRARYGSLSKILQGDTPGFKLVLKSRFFVDKRYRSQTWYQNVLARDYDTFVQRLNFEDGDETAREINRWASGVTRGAINNLITGDAVRGNEMLLASAVYFKGLWLKPFAVEDSYVGSFASPLTSKTTRFMTQTDLFYISESDELDSQIIRLPYKGKKLSMYVVLPRTQRGLNEMLKKIRPFLLRRSIWDLEQTMVTVTLPIFKYESTVNLREVLVKMGVKSLFNSYDHLIGIKSRKKGSPPVKVSNIIQKATIEISESGTTAAAVTETRFVNKFGFPPIKFNASHPFMFFIKNEETGTVVFQGKFVDPLETVTSVGLQQDDYSIISDEDKMS